MLPRRRFSLLAVLLTTLAASFTLVAPAHAVGTGDIVGSVAGRDGQVVPSAKVEVFRDGESEPVKYVYSYGSTTFRVPTLPPGDYRLRATGYSIVESWYGEDAEHPKGTAVHVDENVDTTLAGPFLVTSKPSILGSAVDTAGAPAAEVSVCARRVVDGGTSPTDAGCGWTDPNGAFSISPLEPGTYRLFLDGEKYVRSWFGGHSSAADSRSFTVAPGERLEVGSTTVASGGVVTGRVVNEAGSAITWAGVAAYVQDDSGRWQLERSAQTDGAGRFRMAGLPNGPIRVRAQDYNETTASVPTWFPSAVDAAAAESVAVTQDVVTGLPADLVLRTGGTVTGRITTTAGVAVSDPSFRHPSVTAYRWDVDTREWVYGASATATADGTYTVRGLTTGRYRVSTTFAGYTETWYSNDPTHGSTDAVGASEVSVTVGQGVTGIDIAVRKLGAISGRVVDADGNRLRNITVTPYARQDGQWTAVSDAQKTDADGNYLLTGLPAGEYKLRFEPPYSSSEYVLAPSWLGERTMRAEDSRSVHVGWEATTSVTYQTLRSAPVVTGSVTNAAGTPLTNAVITAYTRDPDGSWVPAWQKQANWNTYSMGLGRAGTYKFELNMYPTMRPAWYGGSSLATATEVTLYPGDRLTFDAVLSPFGTIDGTIVDDNGNQLVGQNVRVYAWTVDPGTGEWVNTASVIASYGSFILQGIDDQPYKIQVRTDGTPYAPTWYGGDSLETATAVHGLAQGTKSLGPIQLTTGLAVTPVEPVAVTGTPIVGQTLTVRPGTWSTEPALVSYTWRRDGNDVAQGDSYTLRAADVGHDITVTATASKPQHKSGTSTSEPVRPSATSTTKANGAALGGRKVRITGSVAAAGVRQVTGKVTAYLGSRVVGRTALSQGKLNLLLSRLPVGRQKITLSYLGSSTVLPSTGVVRVRVR